MEKERFLARTARLYLLFLTAFFLPGQHLRAAGPPQSSWFSDKAASLIRSVAAEKDPVACTNLLYRISTLEPVLDELDSVEKCFREVAEDPARDPLLRAEAEWLLVDLNIERGRLDRVSDGSRKLGLIREWLILGPFDNEAGGGCTTPYPPEEKLDFGRSYTGKERPISWRKLPASPANGYVDLKNLLQPSEGALAYAATFIYSPVTRPAAFRFGADDSITVFLNGRSVFENEWDHPADFDQHAVGVTLLKGWNEVLLKICQLSDDWGFFFRVTDPDGDPIDGLKVLADPAKLGEAPSNDREEEPAGTGVKIRDLPGLAREGAGTGTLQATLALGQLLYYKSLWGEGHRPDIDAFEKALAIDPGNEETWTALSRAYESPEQKLVALQKVLAIRKNPEAYYFQGVIYSNKGHDLKALQCFAKAKETDSSFFLADLRKAVVLSDRNLFENARLIAEGVRRDHPDVSLTGRYLGDIYSGSGLVRQAADAYRASLRNGFGSAEVRRKLFDAVKSLGDTDTLVRLLDREITLNPTDTRSRLRKAALLFQSGKTREAFAEAEKAREISPEDDAVPIELGEFFKQEGNGKDALRCWREALAIRPQNQALRERVEFHSGEEAFQKEFELNGAELVKNFRGEEKTPRQGKAETGTVLADLTVRKVFQNGISHLFSQALTHVATDEEAKDFSVIPIGYDPSTEEVELVRAKIYKPDGTILEGNDIGDIPVSAPESRTYYDYRERLISFSGLKAGDICELQYTRREVRRDVEYGNYFGDLVFFQGRLPRKSQEYILLTPPEMKLNYRGVRMHSDPVIQEREGEIVYRWKEVDTPALVSEPMQPGKGETASYLHISTFSGWKEMADWYRNLIRNQFRSGRDMSTLARDLAAGTTSELEAVKKVYGWVAKNTRYVALEFGIHGHKPYPVTQVFLRRFGDCKDKASLLVALLGEIGVDAKVALLRTSNLGRLETGPPSLAVFNHAITYVPKFNLWLDGTAEFSGSGELPYPDQDTQALIIDEGTTALTTTPADAADANQGIYDIEGTLDRKGGLAFSLHQVVKGQAAAGQRSTYANQGKQKETAEKSFQQMFPGCTLSRVSYSDLDDLEAPVESTIEGFIPAYAVREPGAQRIRTAFVRHDLSSRFAALEDRKTDLLVGYPRILKQTITIGLPAGVRVLALPDNRHLESVFGSFDARYTVENGALRILLELRQDAGRIPAGRYPDFRRFCSLVDQVASADVRVSLPPERSTSR
jgi:tetratricopeptide (TPR) repeat protein